MNGNLTPKPSLWKRSIIFVLSIYLILLLPILISYISTVTSVNDDLAKKADTMIELAVLSLTDPMWSLNMPGVIANGKALMRDSEICLVEIKDSGGKVNFKEEKDKILSLPGNMVVLRQEIKKGNIKIGQIKLGITKFYRKQSLLILLFQNIILTTILAGIVGILMFYFITQSIIKPISDVSSSLSFNFKRSPFTTHDNLD